MTEPAPGLVLPLPGRRARLAATAGGGVTAAAAAAAVLIKVEATLARKTIGRPFEQAPDGSGTYGSRGRRLRLAVLGDSAAAGLGCERADQTPGALLAGGLARDLHRRVELRVVARSGARSSELDVQVGRALVGPVDLAFVLVGANDVTGRVPPAEAARDLARAVRTLRAAGAQVVVGTCPDLGTVKPLLQPLRSYARLASRRLATAQTVAVVEEGGYAVSLGDLLARSFLEEPHLWSADRYHPSASGYRRITDAVLPSLLEAAGLESAAGVPVSDSVQDVTVAARVAAREPGLAVEAVEDTGGAADAAPGRLARLTRRLPLVGRGAPAAREDEGDAGEASEQTGGPTPAPVERADVVGTAADGTAPTP